MSRNLDVAALRSFVAVADAGGVTRAAGLVHLTQSAVSMQIKRLEESLGVRLFDRGSRGVTLTPSGEQLLGFARRMLDLNDAALLRLTDRAYEGQIALGVPHDLIGQVIPLVLRQMAEAYPRVRVNLVSALTRQLKDQFAQGALDFAVTTESGVGDGGETLDEVALVWMGAPGGSAWRRRPLPLAVEGSCAFRPVMLRALDSAGIAWEMALEADYTRATEAAIEADLAIYAQLSGTAPPGIVPLDHGGALPALPPFAINLYRAPTAAGPAADALAEMLRAGYRALSLEPSQRLSRPQPASAADPGPLRHAIRAACG
jgi:DNA-binding transcriptional LysR family regulator